MSARKAPAHLSKPTAAWWRQVVSEYALEAHHERLLTLAAEAWDRGAQAREALAEHGLTFLDRHGAVRPRPEVAVERDSRTAYARLVRELRLDDRQAEKPDDDLFPAWLAQASEEADK